MYMTEHCTFTLKETELKSCHVILRQDLFIDRTVCFPANRKGRGRDRKGRVYLGVILTHTPKMYSHGSESLIKQAR